MPPLVLSANDSEYTNNASLSDAPAVWMTGDRIRFINSESGRVIASTVGVAAIRMDGADGVVINQAGGIIRTATMDGTQLVIQGSAGSDRVENDGTIVGLVALGEGSDTFISRRASGDFQTAVDLGGGDDVYHLQSVSAYSQSGNFDGGAGIDRYIISETSGNVGGFGARNFEILEIRGNGFMEGFAGYETVVVDFRGAGRNFTAFRFSDMPDAQVEILAAGNNQANVSIYDRSAIAGVTGSAFNDSLDLGNDTIVSGTIDLGGGDDYMVVRRSQFSNPQQSVFGEKIDGGAGTDTLSIQLQGGDMFDAGNVVNFERVRVSANAASDLALIIRNADHVSELTISPFYPAPIRLEASDLSAGSVKVESAGSLIIAADSVVGLVYSLTPFPIDTPVADDTKSISIVNDGQILGEVRLYIGDDLLDSRAGTVGGHVLGYAGNDRILTDAGDNWLDGGAGADYLSGGIGNDVLIGGSAGDTLLGGAGLDLMTGGTGDDFLDGGADADALGGQAGNDTYIVDNAGDVVTEAQNEGRDVVYALADYVLTAGAEVEILSAISQAAATPLQLTGNELRQEIYGNAGANFLDGGGGADYLRGFDGNDTYIVDNGSDYVFEAAGGGGDVIYARTSFTLQAGTEVEVLSVISQSGGVAIDLTGNERVNELYGNTDANFLDGGGGADTMQGFRGNDTYVVDTAADSVLEGANEGTRDVIYARSSYTMAAGVAVEVLSVVSQGGGSAIDLTGNELFQELYGNTDANFLDGGAGADWLQGFAGNDSYIVDSQADVIVEGANEGSRDVLFARASYTLGANVGVEVLTTISSGATTAIDLTGNALANELYGNAGANVLNGGLGADYLQGFGGADTFAFTTALGSGNVDQLADFLGGTDKVALDDAIFAQIGAPGALNANAFFAGTAAHDADDRIIYDSATGNLYYDADGNGAGAQILFASLGGQPAIAASDFMVI